MEEFSFFGLLIIGFFVVTILYNLLTKTNFVKEQKKNIDSSKSLLDLAKNNLKISVKYFKPILVYVLKFVFYMTFYLMIFLYIYSITEEKTLVILLVLTLLFVRVGFIQKEIFNKKVIVLSPEEHERIKKGVDSIEKYKEQG